jgi:arylformamidase
MRVFDVTRELAEDTLVYPGDPVPRMIREDAGQYLVTEVRLGTHTGTHIDAPAHYLKNDETVDRISLQRLIGPAHVVDLRHVGGAITPRDLAGRCEGAERLLLRTWFSGREAFDPGYPALSVEAARYLTERGITCVGIDAPSVEAYDGDGSVHRHLLKRGVVVLELLDLTGVPEGKYTMIALPLRLRGLDGSPARVVLVRDQIPEV